MNENELRDRLFLMLEKRFRQIMQEKHCNSITAFTEAIPEWELLLLQHGIEVTYPEDFRKNSRRDLEVVCDPSHDLGLRLGLLTGGQRFLEMSKETATKILVLGELP